MTGDEQVAAQQKLVQTVQLAPGDLSGFEYMSTRWDAKIGQNVTPDQLLNPAFWAHQALQLRPFDEIRARSEDGSWIAHLVVLDCSRTWAKVKIDRVLMMTTSDVAMSAAQAEEIKAFIASHNIVWRSPTAKWAVIREIDKSVIHEGEASKTDAATWLEKHANQQVTPKAATVPA